MQVERSIFTEVLVDLSIGTEVMTDSGKRVSNALVTYLEEEGSSTKVEVILHNVLVCWNWYQRWPLACYATALRGASVLSGCW